MRLDQVFDETQRRRELDLQRSRSTFLLLLAIPSFVLLLCFLSLCYGEVELLREIVALLIGLGGGGVGGYTLGRASKPIPRA